MLSVKQLFLTSVALVLSVQLFSQSQKSVLHDPSFAKGLAVECVSNGDSLSGKLLVDTLATPEWHLCQPNSRFDAARNTLESRGDNSIFNVAGNGNLMAKVVRINPVKNVLYLECNASAEYTGIRRPEQPWVGLWVAQRPDSLAAASRNNLELRLDYRITSYEDCMGFLADHKIHSAVCCACFVLRNTNPQSSSYGRYLKVAIPLFDNRFIGMQCGSEVESEGGMVVYRPSSDKVVSSGKFPKIKQKESIVIRLLPLCSQALKAASVNDYMTDAKPEDFVLDEFRVGWEMKGTFNSAVEIKNLKLSYL